MSREQRCSLIKELESKRDDHFVICYITSTRIGHELQMGDDILPRLYRHLELAKAKNRTKNGVDLFIHSNGGSGTAPWRIVDLIREYTDKFSVLVPHHAFSAATLTALGADSIVMHKMGLLGPIDPSVTTPFNPPNPQSPGQLVPISVEDVSAYFTFVKEEVGIQHEDELIQALIALTEKIPPLALGTVQRTHNQSRMLAGKLLKKHMPATQAHEIEIIIENLKSNLYFHGHPINRHEAKEDLKLKVEFASGDLEDAMWTLYESYEEELNLNERFNPLHELELYRARVGAPSAPAAPITTQQILAQMQQLAQAGLGLGGPGSPTEDQLVKLATAMIPIVNGSSGSAQPPDKFKVEKLKSGYLESVDRTDVFLSDLTIERTKVNTPAGPQDATKQEPTWQRWEIED